MKRKLMLLLLIACPVLCATSQAKEIPDREKLEFLAKARTTNPNVDLTATFADDKAEAIKKSFDASHNLKILSYNEKTKTALVEVRSLRSETAVIQRWCYDGEKWTAKIDKHPVKKPGARHGLQGQPPAAH